MTSGRRTALLLVPALALLAAGSTVTPPAAPAGTGISVDESVCGKPPLSLPAGPMVLNVSDATRQDFTAVYVIDPVRGEVFGEVRSVPPRMTVPLTATLGAGRYAFRCVFSNGVVRTSRTFLVSGATAGAAPGVEPMPDLDLEGPVDGYRAWVGAALPGLLAACRTLDADVGRGDLTAARTDWLTAHLDYERLGAAYNAFGDFDDEINGPSSATGFAAIENGLWHGRPAGSLRSLTRGLVAAVAGLVQDFPSEDIDPADLPLRAHEILENTLRFQLTGAADHGSGTTLATAYANTQGTRELLTILAPLIRPRAPGLVPSIGAGLDRVQTDLLAARSGSAWTPPARLSTAQRERLDGDIGAALEQLSDLPTLLAPRPSA